MAQKQIVKENISVHPVEELPDIDINHLIPKMEGPTELVDQEKESIVSDKQILDLYSEILDNCRQDRVHADDILSNFVEMVMNEGEASSASKEAIVNLLKIKSETADKMTKVADLMTRIKLKERDTFPRYLAQQQNNKVIIESSKREMIKSISKLAQKGKSND